MKFEKNLVLLILVAAIVCGPPAKTPTTGDVAPRVSGAAAAAPNSSHPSSIDELSRRLLDDPDYEDLSDLPGVALDIRYATIDNFMNENLYGDFRRCFLHRLAAAKLRAAAAALAREKPGWKLLIFDCLRPRQVQRRLWERVRGTPEQAYVADPAAGSVHNFGFAVDLSLRDAAGREADMGTPYDSFQALAQPAREKEFLKSGRLTPEQHEHRLLLRRVMTAAGFRQLPHEWWHYDALPGAVVRKRYKIVE